MTTPIIDFVKKYAESGIHRLHMPGHKGALLLGFEALDITEISGADSLYEASGIIAESEQNASELFGAHTYYSTEGSSQCIRAMLYLAAMRSSGQREKPLILAGRNAHKTFLSAAALLDLDVEWIGCEDSYLSCAVDTQTLNERILSCPKKPVAVYITSPDYLGNTADIAALSTVCKSHGVLLLVDNAHGAYLKFLSPSRHPIDLGADMCCDSAHKTLPALTGAAYLHINLDCPTFSRDEAKRALALFGSTSPSYLILQSLDALNAYLSDSYKDKLKSTAARIGQLRSTLSEGGYTLLGDEPLKLTVGAKPYGYTGSELADILRESGIECEFADPDYLVLMITPELGVEALTHLEHTMLCVPKRSPILDTPPKSSCPERVMSIREATLCESEMIPANSAVGRILADASVGCPPAVPIAVCGERIDEAAVACFVYYGVECVRVVKNAFS